MFNAISALFTRKNVPLKAKIRGGALKTLLSVRKICIYYNNYNKVIFQFYLKTLKNLDNFFF